MSTPWRGIATLALALLAGCATFPAPRQVSTEAEALAVFGEPVERWHNGDSTTTLEYSTQPMGATALMITVDRSGAVLRQEDALSQENLARVERGMTREQVSRLLGRHRSVERFVLSGEEVWDWNIRNDGPGVATRFNVHFIDGKVVRTSRSFVYPNDGMDRSNR
ncbi:MAG TPA: outer membrane protein assembly factor BamE [Aromatoleum sp.]|uniref:outer membrane protein assembly factor BamE domain-containing protein n=1 Tax=Aromatoleum sp. TaxID=2307007 RepID=UPI002B49CA9F|nr:outer membrane protein assembly factor BamE [Aromatoleum sp.]HJV24840.1 outer membrane protein assembly factor BamE [Aromatoleum sp.]